MQHWHSSQVDLQEPSNQTMCFLLSLKQSVLNFRCQLNIWPRSLSVLSSLWYFLNKSNLQTRGKFYSQSIFSSFCLMMLNDFHVSSFSTFLLTEIRRSHHLVDLQVLHMWRAKWSNWVLGCKEVTNSSFKHRWTGSQVSTGKYHNHQRVGSKVWKFMNSWLNQTIFCFGI